MRIIRAVLLLLLAIGVTFVLNMSISSFPPMGKFLDPFAGMWQNAGTAHHTGPGQLVLKGMKQGAEVWYDDRMVPHIFAENNHDLLFAKGYTEAQNRLFQLEFTVHLASGRLSEMVGHDGLEVDRYFRRIGMRTAAEKAYKEVLHNQQVVDALEAYTAGINSYIESLEYEDYPLEYKLLDYHPQQWKPINTIYLLKLMSFNLTGHDRDFEMTNALRYYGDSLFQDIYPEFPDSLDPVIPVGTPFGPDTFDLQPPADYVPSEIIAIQQSLLPHPNNGSNNWAAASWKTKSGAPLLANDPHLGLHLPSFWYEVQLHSPEMNVYGATLPGSPAVVIGFNNHIAWGMTNAERDVKDWYRIKSGAEEGYYQYGNEQRKLETTVETIKIKGGSTFYDTVSYTHFGPVVFDQNYLGDTTKVGYALRWKAHDPSAEPLTFLKLSSARNYTEFLDALTHYEVPAQTFAFASRDSNIAIRQQGVFPMKWHQQGKFVLDGSNPEHQWQGTIPLASNPHILNPERGFVSSSNQHPTDSTYPFYYNGSYEYYRNRRINNVLAAADSHSLTPEMMMDLQNDNKSLYASSMLEVTMPVIEQKSWDQPARNWISDMKDWDHFYNAGSKEAAFFEAYWEHFMKLIMEKQRTNDIMLPEPDKYVVIELAKEQPAHTLFDLDSTQVRETAHDLMIASFSAAIEKINQWKSDHEQPLTWANYKSTTLSYLIPGIDAFNINNIHVGGNKNIVNAMGSDHGPGLRIVVSMEQPVKAWIAYAGGQSGNPGSPHYDDFVETWANGDYFEAQFLQNPPDITDPHFHLQKLLAK